MKGRADLMGVYRQAVLHDSDLAAVLLPVITAGTTVESTPLIATSLSSCVSAVERLCRDAESDYDNAKSSITF
jgi:hypothetical protein